MHDSTLDYYNKNAIQFINNTQKVNFTHTQDQFLSYLQPGSLILDFGCGSGRDTKYFLEKGYRVEAIDGSIEFCKLASQYTQIEVKHMLFQDLNVSSYYDGIWACSSILHLNKDELKDVLVKIHQALKKDGYFYTSFKYGEFEGLRNERYFTDLTEDSFKNLICEKDWKYCKQWISNDVRKGRGEEKWLNIILQKQ